MSDVLGIDFLTNPKIAEASNVDLKLDGLESIELPTLTVEEAPAPKLVPNIDSVGPIETSDGLKNLNAEQFMGPSHSFRRVSEENVLKEKYEILRKFERLSRLGVPMRKRFTLDSPLDEMKMELEFIKREKDMDATIKQFCDWFITGMSALEWSSKNVPLMKAFGLQLEGLSESAQMNVGDMEDDFEELYDLYGDKLKMHPLVRIPIRTCMMVYMVHLTNQMARKAPIPNIDEVMRNNPDIARQLASAAMQQQTQSMRAPSMMAAQAAAPPPPSANPLAGFANFMSGMVPPPPEKTSNRPPPAIKSPVKLPKPSIPQQVAMNRPEIKVTNTAPLPPTMSAKDMKGPTVNIDELLKSVNANVETKKVSMAPSTNKKGGSTGKNSVTIKL